MHVVSPTPVSRTGCGHVFVPSSSLPLNNTMSNHPLPFSPRSSSHSRSPSSSAPSQAGNTLESLSRTISSLKSYVPSVPSGTLKSYVPSLKTYAEPSPPSVSRPLSFATFSAAGEVEEGSVRGRGRGRGRSRGIRGDAYQREEYVDFQADTYERDGSEGAHRGRAGRDEDLYWDQRREVSLDERPRGDHPRPRQEFERDYELDQDFDGYVRGSDAQGEVEARERVTGEDQADTDLIRWTESGDEPLMGEEEDGPLSNREEDGEDRPPRVDEVLHQVEDIPSRRSDQDGPSRRSEQIAPPSWRVPSRREGEAMERRHVRQKTVVPPNPQQTALPSRQQTSVPLNPQQTAVPPSRQQTIVPGRHNALLDRQQTIVPGKHAVSQREDEEEEDTPVLEFARQGGGLAQVMKGVAGQPSGRRGVADQAGVGKGAADQRTAADASSARGSPSGRGGQRRPGEAVVDLSEEDESAQGIVDLGAEEIKATAGGEGGAKHAYAHPAREADLISWARWDLLGDK